MSVASVRETVREDIREDIERDEQQLIEDAVLYLQENRYRDDCTKNEKRSIRRKAKRFMLQDGDLLYTKKDNTKVCDKLRS